MSEASTASETMQLLDANPTIDLVLLDLVLPDMDGLAVLKQIGERLPSIAVIVLSALKDKQRISTALQLGAAGYIPKSADLDIMKSAINLVLSGGIYVPPEYIDQRKPTMNDSPPIGADNTLPLTQRQIEVLKLMVRGQSNKEICRELDIAQPTVKIHVSAILKALKVRNRTEAAFAARQLGIIV